MRIALLCPGRGSYTKRTMRTLPRDHAWVQRGEELRAEYGLQPLLELDYAKRFRSAEHLRADNVSPLIYLNSMLDAHEAIAAGNEAVCVAGNSMGWYTALAVAGALDFEDGFRLVQEMALLQMEHGEGGQVLYPLIDEEWRMDPRQQERIDAAILSSDGQAFPSIDLGGYAVLAGTEGGVEHLLKALPFVEMGPTMFPYRLKGHGPYHTALLDPVAEKAARQLSRLDFRAPRVALIDGRGSRFTPASTDPKELAAYTLGPQITTRFRFTTSVRVALREYAPDKLALPGPGNTLGGVCGQILVAERWQGIDSRTAFESNPQAVWSLRR